MKDIGMMHYFLGIEVCHFPYEIFLKQGKYATEILNIFGMLDYKAMNTLVVTKLKLLNDDSSERVDVTLYRQIIESLVYLTNTRPDICFFVNTLSHYMVEPRHVHLVATKYVMRYLKGTLDYGLIYAADSEIILHNYTNSYWEGNTQHRKSTSRYCFSLGSCVISWLSKNNSVVLSTTEDE